MIPILMAAFAAGGTSYGMAEESLAFYAIVLPVFIRAGYDAVTGVAVIMLGCGIGTLGSTFNAFATVVGSNAAGVPFTDGLLLRVLILVLCLAAGILFVMRYARQVKLNPARSVVADQREDNVAHFLKGTGDEAILPEFTRTRSIILALFGLTFAVMLYGVIALGWWMGQMSALFLGMAILTFFVAKFDAATKMDEHTFVDTFVNGARDLLGVALIIGVARGIVVVMDAGKITDTILHAREAALGGLAPVAFINRMLLNQTLLSFLVPSSSGLAVLSMPILAPLADFAGVARSLVVTAYQSANGWVNLFNPTFAVVMGGLAIGRVSYNRWLRFLWPLLVILAIIVAAALSLAAMSSDAPARRRPAPRRRTPRRRTEAMAAAASVAASGGLGLVACTALVVGNMIGSGIFLLPASLAAFGPISLVGWTVTSVGGAGAGGDLRAAVADRDQDRRTLCLLRGRVRRVRRLHHRLGLLDRALDRQRRGGGGAGRLRRLPLSRRRRLADASLAVALIAIWTLTLVNIRGVAEAGFVQVVTTVLKLVPLVLIGTLGFLWIDGANFTPFNTSGQSDLAAISAAAALTLWAYLGLESATVPAGDVIDPERTIPRATILGVLIAAAVYISVTTVAIGVVPSAELATSAAPLADVGAGDVGRGRRRARRDRRGDLDLRHAQRLHAADRAGALRRGARPGVPRAARASLALRHAGERAGLLEPARLDPRRDELRARAGRRVQRHHPARGDVEPAPLRALRAGGADDPAQDRAQRRGAGDRQGRRARGLGLSLRALGDLRRRGRDGVPRLPADPGRDSRPRRHQVAQPRLGNRGRRRPLREET